MSYRAVLRTPHALRTFVAALVGRLSYGIVFVSLTVAITASTRSYSLAGGGIALFGLGVVLLSPLRAGLIDRHGPRRVLPPLAGAYAVLLAALAAATWRPGTPGWLLLVLTATAGACSPPLGPVMRAMWSNLLPDPAGRQRAFALDTVAEELLFVTGPLLAGVFIAAGNPALGVAASAVLVLAGTLAMVSSPAAAVWPRPEAGGAVAALRGRAVFEPVVVVCGIGLGLGALNLLVVAFATGQGQLAAVAWVEAALAAGSAVGGIAYGARNWTVPQRTQLSLLTLALATVLATAGLAPGIAALRRRRGPGRAVRRAGFDHGLPARRPGSPTGDPHPGRHVGEHGLQRRLVRRYGGRRPADRPHAPGTLLRGGGAADPAVRHGHPGTAATAPAAGRPRSGPGRCRGSPARSGTSLT